VKHIFAKDLHKSDFFLNFFYIWIQ